MEPYRSLKTFLSEKYAFPVVKLALQLQVTCPNRDGTLGTGGCVFCSEGGSGDYAQPAELSITEQYTSAVRTWQERHHKPEAGYIIYFQSFTNTYGTFSYLKESFEEAASLPGVVGLSIATRPDCLTEEMLGYLEKLQKRRMVWIELGLQTANEKTREYLRQGYDLKTFEDAVERLAFRKIAIIVHVIVGLPGESEEDVLKTVEYLNKMPIQGVKLQLLHVLQHTALGDLYQKSSFPLLEEETYVRWIGRCISHLRPEIVVHRLTGDGPKELLLGPMWSLKKRRVLNQIHHYLKLHQIRQGMEWGRD